MARQRKGLPALLEYRPLRFAHIPIQAGANSVLVADPWAYLRSYLHQDLSGRSKSPTRTKLNRALYYARQAEGFYSAADRSEVETRGVLAYYGMLNLVKCFLSARKVELETVKEHHGLTIPLGDPTRIEIVAGATGSNVNIFHEFARILGTPVTGATRFSFVEAAHRVPELHGVLQGAGLLAGRPSFLPIQVTLCVTPSLDKYFEEISFEKKHEKRLKTKRFEGNERDTYFKGPFTDGTTIRYQSRRTRSFNKSNADAVYKNSLKRLADFDIASILTRNGYRYYVDLAPGVFDHLCYTLLLMFYLGSIERYRPTVVEEHFFGEKRPLLTEALAICPRQFLYQIVSRVTGDVCVVPFASI